MLLLFLSLFSINCRQAGQATVSTIPLSELMRKSIIEIDSLLNDFQQEIRNEQSVLQAVDQEIQDAGLPGYSLTSGTNHTGNYTRPSLFPYPPGNLKTTTKSLWESWNLPGLGYFSPSDSFSYVSSPGHMPDLGYPLNLTTPFNPNVTFHQTMLIYGPTDLNYSVSFTRPTFPFQRPPRTENTPLKPRMKYISNASYSSGSPAFGLPAKNLLPQPGFLRSVTARAKARTLSEFFAISDLQRAERQRSWYRPRGQRLTKANRMRATSPTPPQALTKDFSPAARRPQPQPRNRTLSKAQAWVQNRQWMKSKAGRTLQRHIRQGKDDTMTTTTPTTPTITTPTPATPTLTTPTPTTVNNTSNTTTVSIWVPGYSDLVPSMSLPDMEEANLTTAANVSDTPSTTPSTTLDPMQVHVTVDKTAITEDLIKEDSDGFLYVSLPKTIPVTVPESTTNTIGQVLFNAESFTVTTPPPEPHQVLHDLMEKMDEGFLTIFLQELARLIAQKPHDHVVDVLQHFEIIYTNLCEQGRLTFFSEEILELGTSVSRMFSGSDVSTLQTRANMMYSMMKNRKEYITVKVNSIIDYADMMYEDDEGEQLFDALMAFYNFPNVTISSYDVCYNMMIKFVQPYKRLRGTDRLRMLTDNILKLIVTKFDNRRRGDTATREPNQTTNKTKRNPSSLRQRIETKGLQMKRRRHQQANPLVVRAVLPITKHQKRFKVITPKQLRSNGYMSMLRPTQAYYRRRLGRPVHPQSGVLPLFPEFPQARYEEFKRRARKPAEQEPHHPKEPATQPTHAAMRDEVRRIVAESSYSDEEAVLKKNLRHALRVHWHRTYTPSVKTSQAVAKY